MKTLFKKVLNIPNYLARSVIFIYQVVFSPSKGLLRYFPGYPHNTCLFYPTCSEYGIIAFKKYPFFTALRKTGKRIARCRPSTTPCVDHP